YAFESWGETNDDRDYSILGMPEESDWIIYGPYSEKQEIQNAYIYELSNELGDYSVRTQYVEMFINSDGTLDMTTNPDGTLNYTSPDYAGLYIFMEKIKVDPNRVDVDKLSANEKTGDDVTGGYIFSFDKDDPGVTDWVSTSRYRFHMVDPDFFDA